MTFRSRSVAAVAVFLLCAKALEAKTVTLISPDNRTDVSQLNPDNEQGSESLLLADRGDALVQLDRDQKTIETKMNLTLRRVSQSQ